MTTKSIKKTLPIKAAAFKQGDIQNFGEGGRILYGGLDKPLETCCIILPFEFEWLFILFQ